VQSGGEEDTAEMMLTIAVGILTLDSRPGLLYHSAFRWFPGAQQSEPMAVSARKHGMHVWK
jgi:hypothetical protein